MTQPSLAGLTGWLAEPAAVTALWAQVLARDLLVGRWIYRDSRGVPPLVMAPVLVLTILLSPVGLPVYLLLRPAWRPREALGHASADRLAFD